MSVYNVVLTTVCILFGHGLESVIEWRWWSEYPIWFIRVTRHYLIYNLISNVFLTGLIKSTYLHTVVPVVEFKISRYDRHSDAYSCRQYS